MNDTLINVYKYGQYYNPAYTHYKNPSACVSCDRCFKSNLKVSIGYRENDLCLKCAYIMSKSIGEQSNNNVLSCAPKPHVATRMKQDMYKPQITTNMMQDIYKPQNKIATFMMQDMY